MTYRCGIGAGMERLGFEPGPPMIKCDGEGCDERIVLDDFPPRWFLAGKAKKGWRRELLENGTSRDWCSKHR